MTPNLNLNAHALSPDDYLKKILSARVYDVAVESALQIATALSKRLGHQVLLKREDQQPVFSFKLRGAYNKMASLTPEQLRQGVICVSAGNHAQGVALSAQKFGIHAVIVMPKTASQVKVDSVRILGGEVVLSGEDFSEAYTHALKLEQERSLIFVHPFDDPDVIAGQGTIAVEILRQVQNLPAPALRQLDAIFVGIGGGGLISGVANYIKAVAPHIQIIGVQMNDSNAMLQSVAKCKRVNLAEVGLFSDGTAVKQVGVETFRIVRELVDDFVEVDTDAVCAAIKDIFIDTRSIVEPAGAMAVAAIKLYCDQKPAAEQQSYAAILSGANMNFDHLRFVAERALVGEEREALFAVTIPEARGSFRRFCERIEQLPGEQRNITEFNYRISDTEKAHVFVGISTERGESTNLAKWLTQDGCQALDLTYDELAKTHIRHMVGGKSGLTKNERLLRFEFPERPGALLKFLRAMQPNWNISLFHYRNQGSDHGNILVGLQVPQQDNTALHDFLSGLGYPFVEESGNPLYRIFLR